MFGIGRQLAQPPLKQATANPSNPLPASSLSLLKRAQIVMKNSATLDRDQGEARHALMVPDAIAVALAALLISWPVKQRLLTGLEFRIGFAVTLVVAVSVTQIADLYRA